VAEITVSANCYLNFYVLNKEKTHLFVDERFNRSTIAWTKNEPDFTGMDCGKGSLVTELETL